ADGGEEVIQLRVLGEFLQHLFRFQVDRQAADLALQRVPALDDILVTLLATEPLANLLPGGGGVDVARARLDPVAPGAVDGLACLDLDDLGVLELVIQRNHLAIDSRANALVAYLGMDAVGEINWRGTVRQLDDVPRRGEAIDLVLEDIRLERLDELLG